MTYPGYPAYKPSGVSWLGDVPEHWDVKRLKSAAKYSVSSVDKVAADAELPVRLCNYTDVYYYDRIHPDMGLMETTATPEEIRLFGLRVDDVLITKDSEEWSDIAVPALVVASAPDLVCGYHLAIIRPQTRIVLGLFLLRAFQSSAINQQFQVAAAGVTRYGLPKSAIGKAWIPLPPLEEQRVITRFLDAQIRTLDTLAANKRALIARLREKRNALISETVSRGLQPDAARAAGLAPHPKLKPSGVDWFGELPEHWELMPLKRAVTFIEGPGILAVDFAEEGVPLLRISGIGGRTASLEGCNFLPLDLVERRWPRMRVECGDVLISASASTGLCSEVDGVTVGAIPYTGIIIVRPRSRVAEKDFIRWFFLSQAFRTQADLLRTGSTIQHFGPSHLSRMAMALPGLVEQRAIADHLDRETARIDQMVAKVEAAIERLQEYRTGLITATVTGKIDVRGLAADAESTEVPSEAKLSL